MNYPPGPYAPPPYGYPPQGPKRSAIPKVIGIMMIIFGGLGILGGLMNAAGGGLDNPMFRDPEFKELFDKIKSFNQISGIVGLLMGSFQLFAGIAAVKYKRSGPRLSISYAITAMVQQITMLILFYAWLSPLLDKAPPAFRAAFGGTFVFFGIISCAWPIVIIALMTRPKAKEACTN